MTLEATPDRDRTIELRHGALRLAVRPDLGASIAGLWFDGMPVLRSVKPQALHAPRDSACFALVPYSNRIGGRRFAWQGREHTLAENVGDDYPHSLHGCAWQRAWTVVDTAPTSATLRLEHRPDADWPFAFDVQQRFELSDAGLRVSMTLRNTDTAVQPVGLGWHPYFPKRSTSRIHVECGARWERDATTHLPTKRLPHRGVDAEVRYLDLDHGFEGWPGRARVRDEQLSVTLASSLEHLVVYTPPQDPSFCIEPVSHAINALSSDDPVALGVRALEPGQSMSAWMTIEAALR